MDELVKLDARRCAHSLVPTRDVFAVGFAVSPPVPHPVRVIIERRDECQWRVVDDGDLTGATLEVRERARSLAAAVVIGANLVGTLMTELDVQRDVRWIRVTGVTS